MEYLIGATFTLAAVSVVIAYAALSAHKRNRILIRRMADEMMKLARERIKPPGDE